MNRVEKLVGSPTLDSVTWHNVRLVRQNLPTEITRLKRLADKHTAVFGGEDLTAHLLRERRVDE
jgi:dihydrofolate reductase